MQQDQQQLSLDSDTIKTFNAPKPPKHMAFIAGDGRVLHPTKGFDNKSRRRGANPRSNRKSTGII